MAKDQPDPQGVPDKGKYPSVPDAGLRGVARTRFDSPNPTAAQLARRAANNRAIRAMGLPVLEHLPVVEDEAVLKLRTPAEVARRCLAVAFCAVKGELDDQKEADALVASLTEEYGAATYFSPKEARFLADPNPPRQQRIDAAWRYECVHVLLWAMGTRDALSPPGEICPVPEDMKLLRGAKPAEFVAGAKRRTPEEILARADFYYRLHWAAVELRANRKDSALPYEGILCERHYALNWLIGYLNQEWDDVTTDT